MKPHILLQTTIAPDPDDWNIGRFSMLRALLESEGCRVTARDRDAGDGDDPVLSAIDKSDVDQLWLFAVDAGDGLTANECAAITRFHERGGGLLVTRDHQDLGSSVCTLGGIGDAHYFHTRNPDPDASRHRRDDETDRAIDWPNYHSGNNGEYQRVTVAGALHPVLRRADGSPIEWLPAHPHEGAVGAPDSLPGARVIATGRSAATARPFNLIVALETADGTGRAIAESSFHHLCDYTWDPRAGCPSFVDDRPADDVLRDPERLRDVQTYVRNAARWLGTRPA